MNLPPFFLFIFSPFFNCLSKFSYFLFYFYFNLTFLFLFYFYFYLICLSVPVFDELEEKGAHSTHDVEAAHPQPEHKQEKRPVVAVAHTL